MKTMKRLTGATLLTGAAALLVGCLSPVFLSSVSLFKVDNGTDVSFLITVGNSATSVSCFSGDVTMTNSSGDTWEGTLAYADIPNKATIDNPGVNTVRCTATNNSGVITSDVGVITMIYDAAPVVAIIQPIDICGNDGSLSADVPTIDEASSDYLSGATYSLSAGTLPAGFDVDASNGNIVGGSSIAGDHSSNGLKIKATTSAGATESAPFSVDIYEAVSCP